MTDPNLWSNMMSSEVSRLDDHNRRRVDNPRFAYPAAYDRDAVSERVYVMKRGYMRMLTELYDEGDISSPITGKLWFQFNPNQLTRSVSAASDIQMWINLDPSQLAVPRPGNMNFGFQLLFNREAEVASDPTSVNEMGSQDYMSILREAVENTNGGIDWSKHVSKLGVLTDIMMLDNIVGQGLSMSLVQKIVDNQDWGEINSGTQSTTTATVDEQTGDVIPFTEESLREALSINIGNGAFLSSQPVRVVFSKMFMVDGFVQTLTVTFNKFSRTLIPTIATVDISMNALYIGFKRRDSVLTYYWKNRKDRTGGVIKPSPDSTNPDRARYDALSTILVDKGGFFSRVSWHGSNNGLNKFTGSDAGNGVWVFKHSPINLDFYIPTSGKWAENALYFESSSVDLQATLQLVDLQWREGNSGPWRVFNTQLDGKGNALNTPVTSTSSRPIGSFSTPERISDSAVILRSANHELSFKLPSNFVNTSTQRVSYKLINTNVDVQYRATVKVSYSGSIGGFTVEGPTTGVFASTDNTLGLLDKPFHYFNATRPFG